MPQGYIITIALVIVFLVWVFIPKKSKKATSTKTDTKVPEVAVAQINEVLVDAEEDESEIVAVIMAAIANSLNTSTYRLNIKSIKRIPNNTPVWNAASRRENIDHQI